MDQSVKWTNGGWLERRRRHTQPAKPSRTWFYCSCYFLHTFLILLVSAIISKPTLLPLLVLSSCSVDEIPNIYLVLIVLVKFLTHIKHLGCPWKEQEPFEEKLLQKLFSSPLPNIVLAYFTTKQLHSYHENVSSLCLLSQVSYCSRTSACTFFTLYLPSTVHLLLLLLFSLLNRLGSKWHLSSFIPFLSSLRTSGIHQIGLILTSDISDPDELCVTKCNIHF